MKRGRLEFTSSAGKIGSAYERLFIKSVSSFIRSFRYYASTDDYRALCFLVRSPIMRVTATHNREISMKLGINVHHMSGRCWKAFQGQGHSEVKRTSGWGVPIDLRPSVLVCLRRRHTFRLSVVESHLTGSKNVAWNVHSTNYRVSCVKLWKFRFKLITLHENSGRKTRVGTVILCVLIAEYSVWWIGLRSKTFETVLRANE